MSIAEIPYRASADDSAVAISTHAGAHFFCRQLTARGFDDERVAPARILVAGCGAGHEAAAIADNFATTVDAIDVELRCAPQLRNLSTVRFQEASICETPFDSESFDAVFYHHVIEHVNDPVGSLREIGRILKPQGWLFIGTPNRHRLVSSVGAHRQTDWDSTIFNKLKDNWQDWRARLTGKFRNEYGAHAGFAQGELDRLLSPWFPNREWLTAEYLRFKYAGHRFRPLISLATTPALGWFAAPSIYVLARRA